MPAAHLKTAVVHGAVPAAPPAEQREQRPEQKGELRVAPLRGIDSTGRQKAGQRGVPKAPERQRGLRTARRTVVHKTTGEVI